MTIRRGCSTHPAIFSELWNKWHEGAQPQFNCSGELGSFERAE